ncbi:MAG: 23S rRNA (adenine(2503)-C(2))-methyltransferase RlmN [Bacillota bacterium]
MKLKRNIKDLDLSELESFIVSSKLPKFRAQQVFEWVYKDVAGFYEMTNLPKALIDILERDFFIPRYEILNIQYSKTDKTRKYLFKLTDEAAVECVLMEYSHGKTACISTQVGCKMACTFCASAMGGFVRNLSCGEMLEEVMAISRDVKDRISNIVLMGMGEPFDNYDEIIKFLKLINNSKGLNVGMRHITVSTSGIVPKIYDFADEQLQCTLAISLHAADDNTRNLLMPINKKYNIAALMEACDYYVKKTNRRITYEYALIKNVNDSGEAAEKLAKLLRGQLCHVNLIPMNSVEGKAFEKSPKASVQSFKELLERRGIEATIRRELGSEIDAACGQLRRRVQEL